MSAEQGDVEVIRKAVDEQVFGSVYRKEILVALDRLAAALERAEPEQGMKQCPYCGEVKPVTEFNKNRTRRDGLQYGCRSCHNIRRAEDERKNPRAQLRNKRRTRESIASEKVRRAVRDGTLIKPDSCENCGRDGIGVTLHGHHQDYSKPLEVIWLCPACHADRHGDRRDALDDLIEQASRAEKAERALAEIIEEFRSGSGGYDEDDPVVIIARAALRGHQR